mgnify:FL=1|jgi:chaperonin GroES
MSEKKIKPLGNRVLVKRLLAEKTKGGIILPDSAQEKPKQGKVIAVGEGNYDDKGNIIAMNLKVDDKVLFSSYSGTEVPSDNEDEDLLIMTEEDVLAIIE